jgi:hypothetical protein
MHGMLWNMAPRLSVFLMAVLSISRTISLVYPLRRIRRQDVALPILFYTALQLVQATLPFWFGAKYRFVENVLG